MATTFPIHRFFSGRIQRQDVSGGDWSPLEQADANDLLRSLSTREWPAREFTAEEHQAFATLSQQPEGENGWICWNDGPQAWFWFEDRASCDHELSDDIRPATPLEKVMLSRTGGTFGLAVDEWDGLDCYCGGGWKVGHAAGCPEDADDALISQQEAVRLATDLLLSITGQEGGQPRINWYLLRNRIADAFAKLSPSSHPRSPAPKALEWIKHVRSSVEAIEYCAKNGLADRTPGAKTCYELAQYALSWVGQIEAEVSRSGLVQSTPTPVSPPVRVVDGLAEALADLTDAFISRHGGSFPLDKVTDDQKHWNRAMSRAYELVGQPGTPDRDAKLASLCSPEAK